MLSYFPRTYPDELLYSVLARYHRHVCSSGPKQTLEELFGVRDIRAAVDLQTGLGALSRRIPPDRGLSAARLAGDFTLFPYLTAFQSADIRCAVLGALRDGPADWVHVRLGLAAGSVRPSMALRTCPACAADMQARYGELYWRRSHQLPGVLVCPDHGRPLVESQVRPTLVGQHAFVAADEETCPQGAPCPPWPDDSKRTKILRDIAGASAALLVGSTPARDVSGWGAHYRQALVDRGFGKGRGSIAQNHLADSFVTLFEPILDVLPEAAPETTSGNWLAAMARKHRKAFHPLRHVLMQLFLDAHPIKATPSPFGHGPWPCRNPLADHYGQAVIRHVETHRGGGKTIGRFACACGYIYGLAEGEGSPPCIIALGPLFDEDLRRLAADGCGLRAVGRALHVDPGTVRRHAERLGLAVAWKPLVERSRLLPIDREGVRTRWTANRRKHPDLSRKELVRRMPAEHAWLYRNDRTWLKANMPSVCPPVGGGQRLNWPQIDCDLANRLRRDAAALKSIQPPLRLSRAEFERRLGMPGWLARRLDKLSACASVLEELSETVATFQLRRVARATAELEHRGYPIQAWRVRRMAGLRGRVSPGVEEALASLPGSGGERRK